MSRSCNISSVFLRLCLSQAQLISFVKQLSPGDEDWCLGLSLERLFLVVLSFLFSASSSSFNLSLLLYCFNCYSTGNTFPATWLSLSFCWWTSRSGPIVTNPFSYSRRYTQTRELPFDWLMHLYQPVGWRVWGVWVSFGVRVMFGEYGPRRNPSLLLILL